MGEKAFLFAGEALPADVGALVRWRNERVVMFHLPIAAFTADGFFVNDLWIKSFDHIRFSPVSTVLQPILNAVEAKRQKGDLTVGLVCF